MPSLSLARPALLLLVVSLGGCRIVDMSQVQFFGCAEGGQCPSGLLCCPDNTCRASCSSAVTGGGAGGGGGSAGGSDGGTATGGGGGGGASTADAGPRCGPTTCPSGCCDGNTCVQGQQASRCGRGGIACAMCPPTDTCVDGACSGCLQTCDQGCCSGAECVPRTATTCGANGTSCSACGQGADTCTDQGDCRCGSGPACALGQRCAGGQCVCDGTSCASGCCTASGTCLRPSQQSAAQCGLAGAACVGCDAPPPSTCTGANKRAAFTTPGACLTGACQYPTREFDCGFGCENGSCVNDNCQGCLVAPQATCVGSVRRSYQSPGSCGPSGCTFTQVDETCTFGCTNGACNANPCTGVTCASPPAARCTGNVLVTHDSPGACSDGACSYPERQTTCQFGCNAATGQCVADPCAGTSCTSPPAAECATPSSRKSFVSPGACSQGTCSYAEQLTTCANGCIDGQCQGDPCQGVTCTTPPAPICLNGTTRRTYASTGTCGAGSCSYPPTDSACPFGCASGNCQADPCTGISCTTPPGPTCQGNLRRTYASAGTCSGGTCAYASTDTACTTPPATTCTNDTRTTYASTGTCSGGTCQYMATNTSCPFGCNASTLQCNPDPCAGVSCTTPPAASCLNGTTVRRSSSPGTCGGNGACTYPTQDTACDAPPAAVCASATSLKTYSGGACSSGACTYTETTTDCANGCSNGACNGDPCAGVTCTTPPAADCPTSNSKRSFAATGTCSLGTCSYTPTVTQCNTPPAAFCATPTTLRAYATVGTCTAGACGYTTSDTTCQFGCANGACNADPCAGVTCTTPPTTQCANATTQRTFANSGACSGGSCNYNYTDTLCNSPPAATCNGTSVRTFGASGTCSGGVCSYPPTDTPCTTPPAPQCVSGAARVFSSQGTCSNATCQYTYTDTTCSTGCTNGVCNSDPCASKTCSSPPPSECADATTLRTFSSSGTCSGGTCTYGATLAACPYGCDKGACTPCGPTTCADGCCSNNYCWRNAETCRGTGGGVCSQGCSGNCACGVNQCISGVCQCSAWDPSYKTSPEQNFSEAPIICPL